MQYLSTRNKNNKISFTEAVLKGISEDGGLYVPESFPIIDIEKCLNETSGYIDLCFIVLKEFLTEIEENDLNKILLNSYDDKFDTAEKVVIRDVEGNYFLELFHGPTLAFKDMALSVLPYFIKEAKKIREVEEKTVILTATSGDTGKAALQAFHDMENIEIIVIYPEHGVSNMQKLQMKTQLGKNVHVIGIEGNFDDAQTAVKKIFNDNGFKEKMRNANMTFSSANSINIGRLLPQIVYYFYTYLDFIRKNRISNGEKINYCVPTGNFGDILAGYYASLMGLPVNRLICASNRNKVLSEFFDKGIYDINREFYKTISPSMDILISSNLERLIFHISKDDEYVCNKMKSLKKEGLFEIEPDIRDSLSIFSADFCDEEETRGEISDFYYKTGYLMDTHTAVAHNVWRKYREKYNDDHKTVILSTASQYKFSDSICDSLGILYDENDVFSPMNKINQCTGVKIPDSFENIMNQGIIHDRICQKEDIVKILNEILELGV